MNQAVICKTIAPLMSEPRLDTERADEALYGMIVEVLEKSGGFWRVRTHYGYEGWTPNDALCLDRDRVSEWQELPKRVVVQAYADVLSEPSVRGWRLESLTRGALISPVEGELEGGWQRVRLCDGREGYLFASFLGEYKIRWDAKEEEALRKAVVNSALSYYGTQYRWGGKTPLGIDCSGLVSMAYLLNGVVIYRDAHIKEGFPVHEIPFDERKPGDLLFFPGHVAMVLDRDRYVHSTGSGRHGVSINSLDPRAVDYREDLAKNIQAVGSIF